MDSQTITGLKIYFHPDNLFYMKNRFSWKYPAVLSDKSKQSFYKYPP